VMAWRAPRRRSDSGSAVTRRSLSGRPVLTTGSTSKRCKCYHLSTRSAPSPDELCKAKSTRVHKGCGLIVPSLRFESVVLSWSRCKEVIEIGPTVSNFLFHSLRISLKFSGLDRFTAWRLFAEVLE